MPSIELDNQIKLHYDVKGEGEPLLLIGGLSTNKSIWSKMIDALLPHFQLIMPDNRGAGLSTQDCDSFTMADMANDMSQLVDHLELPQVNVVGHSMGGMIVQSLCVQHPEKIKKAVIAGSAAKVPKHALWHIFSCIKMMDQGISFEVILDAVFPWIYADMFLADDAKVQQEFERMTEDATPQTYHGYVGQAKAIEGFDLLSEVSKITVPSLVIAGADDVLITKEASQSQLADVIPGARFQLISDCGHMFHREQPQEFARLIKEFILS